MRKTTLDTFVPSSHFISFTLNTSMRIAILGTRGIPNHYGGYEQYAEFLALRFAKRGHDVLVYNSHNHSYQGSEWNNITIIHMRDTEFKLGSVGRFIYNYKCIRDIRKQNCDIILQLDYSTLSLWDFLLPKNSGIVTVFDSLKSKQVHHRKFMSLYLLFSERLAVKFSNHLISDSKNVADYLKEKFHRSSTVIPSGADIFINPNVDLLKFHQVLPFKYNMLIAKLMPQDLIEVVLDGVVKANLTSPFLVIGNPTTEYSLYLKEKYKDTAQIQFIGGMYNYSKRNNLRYFSNLCFYVNTTYSTNSLLVQAMASSTLISTNTDKLTQEILGNNCLYYQNVDDVVLQLTTINKQDEKYQMMLEKNRAKVRNFHNWDDILKLYEKDFGNVIENKYSLQLKKV